MRSGPSAPSARFSAIRPGFGNTIHLAILHQTGGSLTFVATHRSIATRCRYCRSGFECFLAEDDRQRPSKLIKNQNASTMNADRLNLKTSETIISSAPAAFRTEYFGDALGSLWSCSRRYAIMISTTPMNPARSNQVKLWSMSSLPVSDRCSSNRRRPQGRGHCRNAAYRPSGLFPGGCVGGVGEF